jgi:hypothetical protein
MLAEDFQEYCAALTATAVYNVHRHKDAPFMQPDRLMLRRRARRMLGQPPAVQVPGLPQGMRYALPGERPPSSRAPGVNDDVIERFDRYAHRRTRG